MFECIKIIGALLGIIAFLWRMFDVFRSYLRLEVKATKDGDSVLISTRVENRGLKSKEISNALLLVGPQNENPIDTFNKISSENNLSSKAQCTNDIAEYEATETYECREGRKLIPLKYYYSENIRVRDECLSYSSSIGTDKLLKGESYSVRFFLYGKGRLHRSNQDCFVVNS